MSIVVLISALKGVFKLKYIKLYLRAKILQLAEERKVVQRNTCFLYGFI